MMNNENIDLTGILLLKQSALPIPVQINDAALKPIFVLTHSLKFLSTYFHI